MAIPQPAARIVFGGALLAGENEEWSCSLGLHRVSGDTQPFTSEQLAPVLRAWFSDANTRIHEYCCLNWIKVNAIDGQGHYVSKTNTDLYEFPSGSVPRGGGGRLNPPQCSLAVTLRTGVKRGPAHVGRFYLPMPGHEVASTGQLISSQTQPTATRTAGLIEQIHTMTNSRWLVCVLSEKGAAHPVTQVQVGSVMDTQRRRRNRFVETYVSSPIATVVADPGQAVPISDGIG
jgi:hypothetical protein